MSSSHSSITHRVTKEKEKYEVFLSFRGADTRLNFTPRLCHSLVQAGIVAFDDDVSDPRGGGVSSPLLHEIEHSKVSIVVFSKNYANSECCLKELERIMECCRSMGHVVVTVFYSVTPSEVRHKAERLLKRKEEKLRWMKVSEKDKDCLQTELRETIAERHRLEALSEAASIPGFVIEKSRKESEAIKSIVEHVTCLLDKTKLAADAEV